jgi:methyl-accepting chemotaxis protein
MKLTIGKKIGLGFASLLLISGITGGYSIINMRHAVTNSRYLSDDYVPEMEVADRLGDAIALANLNARSFGLTGEASYLAKCRQALVEVTKAVKDTEALAERSTKLEKLKEQAKTAPGLLAAYQETIAETEKTDAELDQLRATTLKSAEATLAGLEAIIESQYSSFDKELATDLKADVLAERKLKIATLNRVRTEFFAVRVANFKSQAQRDPKILEAGLAKFQGIENDLGTLGARLKKAEDIKELDETKKDLKTYETALLAQIKATATMQEVGQHRAKAAAALDDFSNVLSDAARTGASEIAAQATTSLTRSANVTIICVVAALLIGIGIAILITRLITGPLLRAMDLVRQVGGGDLTKTMEIKSSDEIGQMVGGLNDMIGKLREVVAEISQASSNVASGSEELSATAQQLVAGRERAVRLRRGDHFLHGRNDLQHPAERRQRQADRQAGRQSRRRHKDQRRGRRARRFPR